MNDEMTELEVLHDANVRVPNTRAAGQEQTCSTRRTSMGTDR